MSQSHEQVCPWCQTEIVWDPEIGPEETCPHCLNELGDYRSVKLNLGPDGDEEDNDDLEEDLDFNDDEYEDFDGMDEYEEGVQRLLDTQEDTPECPTCHSFMLLAGTRNMAADFVPSVPQSLNVPLLKPGFGMKLFVCPSCFKVEQVLSERERLAMIELLKEHGAK